jgi:hypothetical protein
MPFPFASVVPAFKYTATGKQVSEKDFSTLGKLFSDKKAVTEFLDLWCNAEIVRDIFFEGVPDTDLHDGLVFNDLVATAVSEYHGRYGLVPNVLARRDVTEGEIAVVHIGDEKFFPPVNEFSCRVPLRKYGYQGDRFMNAVRSAIIGFVTRDNEVLLHLLNQTDGDVEEVDPATCKTQRHPGSFPVSMFVKARTQVWEQSIPVPSMITTPHVLRELYKEGANWFFHLPASLTWTTFGRFGDVDLHIVEPSLHSATYVLSCAGIDKGALYALGPPSVLGVRHVKVPLQVQSAVVNDDESLLVWTYIGTWLQGKAVGKSRAWL